MATTESDYLRAVGRYREALRDALVVADDVYKAPELTVFTARGVIAAAWEMQVEYAAMMRAGVSS